MLNAIGLNDPLVVAMAVAAISALSFFIIFGAGQFNVSQPAFIAIGAYAVAMACTHGLSLWLGVLIGLLISIPISILLALATHRLSGVYLAIATLAFVELVEQVINLIPSLNGALGIYGIPLKLSPLYAWLIVLVVCVLLHRLMRSRIGLEMLLLREDIIVARGAGVSDLRLKLLCAVLSACLACVAGAMTALSTSYITPNEFGFTLLISIMTYVIIGGSERYWGSVIGAVLLMYLVGISSAFSDYIPFVSGGILLIVILLAPEGIAGVGIRLGVMIRRRTGRGTRTSPRANAVVESL